MRAASSSCLDLLKAVRTDRRRGLLFLFLLAGDLLGLLGELVHALNQAEDDERNDDKVDDRRDERAKVELSRANVHHETNLLSTAREAGDKRLDDVTHERVHDGRERTADNHANCHVHHVAT